MDFSKINIPDNSKFFNAIPSKEEEEPRKGWTKGEIWTVIICVIVVLLGGCPIVNA